MKTDRAKKFVQENARPLELAIYDYFFEQGTKSNSMKTYSKAPSNISRRMMK